MVFQMHIKCILIMNMCSWSIEWYIEGILKKKQRYIHGILNDILKVYAMVYIYIHMSNICQKEYQRILKIY